MNLHLKIPQPLSSHRSAKDPISGVVAIDVGEPEEELAWPERARLEFKKACRSPGWQWSLACHFLVLISLSFWILPPIGKTTLLVLGDILKQEEDELTDVVSYEIEVETEKSELQELVADQPIEAMVTEEDLALNEEVSFPLIEDTKDDWVEHGLELADRSQIDVAIASAKTAEEKVAVKIQEKVVEAGGKNGEVQFSLDWKTIDDLDLHVVTPDGERIYFQNRKSNCVGILDVDRNANVREATDEPIENVRWLKGRPREGRYTVVVHMFQPRLPAATKYRLMAKIGDKFTISSNWVSNATRLRVTRHIYISPLVFDQDEREKRIAWYNELQADEEKKALKLFDAIDLNAANSEFGLRQIVGRYPHTDTALKAMELIEGESAK